MTDISLTKQMISKQVRTATTMHNGKRPRIQKTFFNTNENIKGYIDYASINARTKCLSVMGSGDHPLNLITKGARDIDTFDINALTEYFVLGFKRALILKCDYNEFIKICDLINQEKLSLEDTCDLINSLLPCMDKKHRQFWREIMNYNYRIQKNNKYFIDLFHMLCLDYDIVEYITKSNNYLNSELEYNKLINNLGSANITFKKADVRKLSEVFNKNKYDVMMLSNILDTIKLDLQSYDELVSSLESIMNNGGLIFLKYIFIYGLRSHVFMEDSNDLTTDKLSGVDIVEVPCTTGLKTNDGMILKRIK